jgi:hypothetical protein
MHIATRARGRLSMEMVLEKDWLCFGKKNMQCSAI